MTNAPFGMTHAQALAAHEALQQFVDNQADHDPDYDEGPTESEAKKVEAAQGMIDQFDTYLAGLATPQETA